MQMTFDQAPRPSLLQAFAARRSQGYMMRSERRTGYNGNSPRRRRPRRKRAGILYVFVTLLLSVLLWPLGMVMLWRKKVRMQPGTKLLISLVTLCASIFLIVYLLTVKVDNPKFTAFQDKANDVLDQAADRIAVAGDAAYKQGVVAWGVMQDFGQAAGDYSVRLLADGLDKGVELAADARVGILKLTGHEVTPEPTEAPEVTPAVTEAAEPAEDDEAEATEAPATAKPAATSRPSPTVVENKELNIYVPKASPKAELAAPLGEGTLRPNGDFEPGLAPDEAEEAPEETASAPTPSPLSTQGAVESSADADEAEEEIAEDNEAAPFGKEEPKESVEDEAEPEESDEAEENGEDEAEEPEATPEPTETPAPTDTPEPTATPVPELTVKVKTAADVTVYYSGGSKGYHTRSCQYVSSNTPAHTLSEALKDGKHACGSCRPVDAALLDEEYVVWVDGQDKMHTTDECARFEGEWRLISLAQAIGEGCVPCDACEADIYAARSGLMPTPTPTPTPEPTPEPTPATVNPTVTLKPAAEAIVYHSTNGKFYHTQQLCKGMTGSSPFKFEDVVNDYRPCSNCGAPAQELVSAVCLWQDEAGLCHTSDECPRFTGRWTLVERDVALNLGYAPCPDCGAEEYLLPNTTVLTY